MSYQYDSEDDSENDSVMLTPTPTNRRKWSEALGASPARIRDSVNKIMQAIDAVVAGAPSKHAQRAILYTVHQQALASADKAGIGTGIFGVGNEAVGGVPDTLVQNPGEVDKHISPGDEVDDAGGTAGDPTSEPTTVELYDTTTSETHHTANRIESYPKHQSSHPVGEQTTRGNVEETVSSFVKKEDVPVKEARIAVEEEYSSSAVQSTSQRAVNDQEVSNMKADAGTIHPPRKVQTGPTDVAANPTPLGTEDVSSGQNPSGGSSIPPNVTATDIRAHFFDQGLRGHGVTQGTGHSKESPMYVGGRNLTTVPDLERIMTAVSDTLSVTKMAEIQDRILAALHGVTWEGISNRRKSYLKLHPYAAVVWTNFFTYDILGPKGLSRITEILEQYQKVGVEGITHLHVTRARQMAQDTKLSPEERSFYGAVAESIRDQTPVARTLLSFQEAYNSSLAVTKFDELVQAIQLGDSNEHAKRITRSITRQKAQGVSARDQVASVVKKQLGWDAKTFNAFYQRHKPMAMMTAEFTDGIFILLPANAHVMIKNNVKGSLTHVIEAVSAEFPELVDITSEVRDRIVVPLLDLKHIAHSSVLRRTFDTTLTGDNMLNQIQS